MKIKLVRDRVGVLPGADELIRPANSKAGRVMALAAKLHEEAAEIAKDLSNPEEYADLLQVLLSLAEECDVEWVAIEAALHAKRERLGTFRRGRVLISNH